MTTRRELFIALCDIANQVQATAARLETSPSRRELEQIVEQMDRLIDQILDDAIAARHRDVEW